MPKRKPKIGRPRLPKGEGKKVFIHVRVAVEEAEAFEGAAKAAKLRPSAWIRSTLNAAIGR
jgi:hypothetical protein